MEVLLSFIVVVILLVLPLKFAAQIIGARHTGFFNCLYALLIATLFQFIVHHNFTNSYNTNGWLMTIPIAGLAYTVMLGTSFLKGILIAIVQVILAVLLTALVASLMAGV